MLSFLKHHKDGVETFYPGIVEMDEAIKVVKGQWLPGLKRMTWRDGSKVYPNIDEFGLTEALATLIVAINTGNCEILPEWSEGRRNRDLVCQSCGNLEPSAVHADWTMCGVERKVQSFYRKSYFNLHEELKNFMNERQGCNFSRSHNEYILPRVDECQRLSEMRPKNNFNLENENRLSSRNRER